MRVSLATEMAPPFVLVAHFFIAGIGFLLLSVFVLPLLATQVEGYFISSLMAAFSHLYLLGFVMMIIFGAMYQLLPVVLEAPIFSKDFAYVQFYMYLVGVILLVSGFTFDGYHLLIPYGAVLTYASMLIFCVNVFITFYQLEQWNIVAKFLFMATLFLFVAVSIGLIVGLNLEHGFLGIDMDYWIKAHMLGTLGGFVMMVIMGVAMVLLPMFSLAHGYSQKWIESALYIHSLSISLGMVALLLGYLTLAYIASGLFVLSSLLFVIQMGIIFKMRVRKQNDYWVRNVVFALFCFTCNSVVMWFEPVLGGVLIFFGFLLPLIVGHIYKILPFLIWYEKFSPLVGKQKVPLLHQMILTRVADVQTYLLFVAIFFLLLAIFLHVKSVFYIGSFILAFSVILVVYNTWYTFTYKIKE